MKNHRDVPLCVLANPSADEKAQMIAEAREKELRDQMSRERGAVKDREIEIARNMLAFGISPDIIYKLTDIDESTLRHLKQ